MRFTESFFADCARIFASTSKGDLDNVRKRAHNANSEQRTANSEQPNSYPLISVLVPVYNTEKYLARCIDSILSQTYPNIELILTDDGSTDNSPAMCDEYARKDSRVRVIHHQVNMGLGAARNSGLDAARGELIGIVDSDDYIAPDMYEKMYALMTENDADMAVCGYFVVKGETVSDERKPTVAETVTGIEALHRLVCPVDDCLHYLLSWNKLYRAELFEDVRFPPATRHDDAARMHRLLGGSRKVALVPESLYYYRIHEASIMGRIMQKDFDAGVHIKALVDHAEAYRDRAEYLRSIGLDESWGFVNFKETYGFTLSMLEKLNCIQHRKLIRELTGYSPLSLCAKMLASGKFYFMARSVKLFLWWLRSMFRPFVKEA